MNRPHVEDKAGTEDAGDDKFDPHSAMPSVSFRNGPGLSAETDRK